MYVKVVMVDGLAYFIDDIKYIKKSTSYNSELSCHQPTICFNSNYEFFVDRVSYCCLGEEDMEKKGAAEDTIKRILLLRKTCPECGTKKVDKYCAVCGTMF